MRIVTLDNFPPELDTLADAAPRATFYHTGTWLHSLAEAYPRMSLRTLVAHDNATPVAFLPFFETRRGFLRRLWSLPFGTYGGPVGTADDAVLQALLAEYRAQAQQRMVVEVGWVDYDNAFADMGGEVEADEAHLVDISQGIDEVWRRQTRHRRKRWRADLRHARDEGVEIRRAAGAEDIERFFTVCVQRLEGRKAPTRYPQRLFASLVERGGERVRIHLAWRGDEVLGGLLNFYYKDAVIAWHGMTSLKGNELQAGKLLLTTCLGEAAEQGFRSFNLGASLGKASLIWYKESLGGAAHPYRTVRHRRSAVRLAAALRRPPKPR